MISSRAIFAFLAATALSAGTLSAQSPGRDALESASERFATVTSLCAQFAQEMEIVLLRQTRVSTGTLCQRRPNFFDMRFSDPEGDRIVADGSHFWIFLPSESPGQVIRIPMSSQPGGLDFYREFLENPFEKYEVGEAGEELVDGVVTYAVDLTPRSVGDWRTARVWIDPAARLIRMVRLEENNGTLRTVTLTEIDLSPDLSDDFFVYEPPSDVNVVSMGGAPAP